VFRVLGARLIALSLFASLNPTLLLFHPPQEPAESKRVNPKERPSKKWIFNDLTQSWRPRGAVYVRDVNAVVRKNRTLLTTTLMKMKSQLMKYLACPVAFLFGVG
jgi:hypothetical protein